MIQQDTMARSIHQPKNNHIKEESMIYTIKDELIDFVIKYSIEPASFLKLTTSIPNFRPIYYYTMELKLLESQQSRKMSSNNNKTSGEHVFKYGSQVYLRMKTNPNKSKIHTKQQQLPYSFSIQKIEHIKTSLFGNTRLFFQIINRNQYLTSKQNQQIILSNQSSNESIWVIQEEKFDKDRSCYRLFNLSNNCYLALSSGRGNGGGKDNQIVFNLVDEPDEKTMFIIDSNKENSQYFMLKPAIQSKIKPPKISPQQGLQIQIMPVDNSVTNLFYQLKYATQIITNNPSIPTLHQIIQQLIYYNISQFGQNQQLLSVPIQKLLSQVGISQSIYQFIVHVFNRVGFDAQLAFLIQNDVRLLCLGSVDNSEIFVGIVTKLLDSEEYRAYLLTLRKLVHCNTYLINRFQALGWAQILLRKLEITFATGEFNTFHSLLSLVGQFCYETHSIANKYLIMHTLQKIYDETYQKNSQQQSPYQSFWVRLFQEGQFVFVQFEQTGKLNEIQLQNYLQMDNSHREIYMGQIQLIGCICSGFNINGINRFYHILKAVSSYCYNQAYPYFKYPQCKQITLEAIVTSFDWGESSRKLQNKYNIGYVFSQSESDQTKSSKSRIDRNSLKYKTQNTKNVKFDLREKQTIMDVLRHFILAFQDHMIYFFNQSKEKNKPLVQLMLSREEIQAKLGSNLGNWIKLICIALDARLITMLKKKAGPYTQYFKKILQPSKKSQQKSGKSKQKTFGTQKRRRNRSPSNFPFTLDKQYQTQINIILDLTTKIISYNPLYDLYLQEMKITNFKNLDTNNNFVQKMITNIRKTNLPYRNSKSKKTQLQNKDEIENYNKVMYMEQLLQDGEKDQIEYVNQIKLNCYRVLSLIFQNIIQEQIQYQVKNLGYSVTGPIKFTSKLTFSEGFKKFPFIDDPFRLALLENWYMTSKPSTLQQVTTLTRYIYDQNQIHIRAINTTIALFTKQSLQLYQAIHPPMSQLKRLTQCLPTWYQPQILKAREYQQNFDMLIGSLRAVNAQTSKNSRMNTSLLVIVDYQQMLENLGLIDVINNLLSHLSRFQAKSTHLQKGNSKRNQQYKDIRKLKSQPVYTEIAQLLSFYIQYSEINCKKLLICVGQSLTTSPRNLQFLIQILKQSAVMETCINLIDKSMMANIVQMLPQSTEALELMLGVEDYCFMLVVEKLGLCLIQFNVGKDYLRDTKSYKIENQLIEMKIINNVPCFRLFCKVTYRMMEICNRGHPYLQWFFDKLLWKYLQNQLSSNTHFKKKQIESISIPTIDQNSSICYLIHNLYTKTNRSSTVRQPHPYNNYKIKSANGQKLLQDYITTEIFATFLDNQTNPLSAYISYYIWDLLPMLAVFQDLLDNQDVRTTVLDRIQRYMGIYQSGKSFKKSPVSQQGKIISMGEDQITMMVTSRKQKQLQFFINNGTIPHNFQPRSMTLLWSKPQHRLPTNPESPRQQQDPFEKTSKKAMKTWFKARLSLNQNRQSYINRDRWLMDVMKLQKQCQGEGKQKQIIINSSDIISKTISILLNSDYVCLSPENQVFLLKNFLLWLTKQTETKDKKIKNTFHHKSIYLIKRMQTKSVLLSILEQIQQKLSNPQSCKNIIAIGYQLRICYYLMLMISTIEQKIKQKIVYKICTILEKLLDCYYLHEEIIQSFQQTKTIDYWPNVMVYWVPVTLLCQFVSRFLQICQMTVDQFDLLCQAFLKGRIRLNNVRNQGLQISINNILNALKQMSQEDFRRENQKILSDPFYQVLNRMQ